MNFLTLAPTLNTPPPPPPPPNAEMKKNQVLIFSYQNTIQGWNLELVPVFPEFRFFFSSPLSSPAIAVFQAIFSRPKTPAFFFGQNLPAFFSGSNLPTFCSDSILLAFFSGPNVPTFFSGPKLPAYFPTQNCRHISLGEIAGIFSDPKLRHLNLHVLFFLQSNEQSL